jgi:hypothetical protein
MQYCSKPCQERDSAQHIMLCSTFKDFQDRPTPEHYRSIYFPPNETSPRFIWLLITGDRGGQNVDSADLACYVAGRPFGRITVTHDFALDRELQNFMVVQLDEDMFGNGQPPNRCLMRMVGDKAARWRGDYVAHAFKYTYDTDPSEFHALDQDDDEEGNGYQLIALDLDTTSLGPLLAWFVCHT